MAGVHSLARNTVRAATILKQGRLFNHVWRDLTQVKNGNAEDAFHPLVQNAVALVAATNQFETPVYRAFEYGGQQPGSTAMKGLLPGDEMAILRSILGDIPLRVLFRGMNGNSLGAHTPESLEKWIGYLKPYGVILKQFQYICDPDELAPSIEIASRLSVAQEVAIPHSPDAGYLSFFEHSLNQLGPMAASVGSISIKRMVAGLTEREVMELAKIFFPKAAQLAIPKVTLHAHDDVNEACALFLQLAAEYGEKLNFAFEPSVDVAHKGSGEVGHPDLFPTIFDIAEILDKKGYSLPISDEQYQLIAASDKAFDAVDQAYAAVNIPTNAFTRKERVHMGMPDGGYFYSYQAVVQARFHENVDLTKEQALKLFIPCYIFFRKAFGMPTSVTPGHKRIEMGTIVMMRNMMEKLIAAAKKDKKPLPTWSEEEVIAFLEKQDYHDLFANMDAATIDAFRNYYLPQPLTDRAKAFLSEAHMTNFLKQPLFDFLDPEEKDELIVNALSKDHVLRITEKLVAEKKLPAVCLSSQTTDLRHSLYHAAGRRAYIESARATDQFTANIEQLRKWRVQGIIGKSEDPILTDTLVATAGLCLPVPEGMRAILRRDHQPVPAPHIPAASYQKATVLWQNHVVGTPGQVSTPLLQYAMTYGVPEGDYPAFEDGADWYKVAAIAN